MRKGSLFPVVTAAIVIIAAACAGCSTQSVTTKTGDFGSATEPPGIVPAATVSTVPAAQAEGYTAPSNVSVRKGGADGTTLVITYNGGSDMGSIKQVEVYTQNSDMAQYEAILKPVPGETVELKGTNQPDRVMVIFRMNDGSSQKLFDRDF